MIRITTTNMVFLRDIIWGRKYFIRFAMILFLILHKKLHKEIILYLIRISSFSFFGIKVRQMVSKGIIIDFSHWDSYVGFLTSISIIAECDWKNLIVKPFGLGTLLDGIVLIVSSTFSWVISHKSSLFHFSFCSSYGNDVGINLRVCFLLIYIYFVHNVFEVLN